MVGGLAFPARKDLGRHSTSFKEGAMTARRGGAARDSSKAGTQAISASSEAARGETHSAACRQPVSALGIP